MTIQQAERFIRDYQELLSDEAKRGSRREPSLLPAPKERVMQAIQLEIAQLFYLNSHTNENLIKPLTNAAMFLDTFSELPLETAEFIESMHRRRREIESFYVELIKLDRADPFYWQRIYTMLNITVETKKTSFFAELRQRLGLGSKSEPAGDEEFNGRRTVGRLTLD